MENVGDAPPADEPTLTLSPFEDAKSRINFALKNLKENKILLQRDPCVIFHGCDMKEISHKDMTALTHKFLYLCSIQDQRRWSTKSSYIAKGDRAYRGVCSRTGNQQHSLIHHTSRTSPKCNCMASFTIFKNGELIFKNSHNELCLPDPDVENDGYVFNSGISPTKKSSIIANITDMLSDYGTTSAAARKQIENSLIKSGDTGFGTGKPFVFEACIFMDDWLFHSLIFWVFDYFLPLIGQLCAPPASFSKSVILSAKKSSGFIVGTNADILNDFLKSLDEQNYPHKILIDDENDVIKAISFHDPKWLPEKSNKNQFQFNVGVSDVTFGITTPKCGISKWSFMTLLTPGHEAFVIVASAITHEDTETFVNEMDLLLDLYPNLKYDAWVLIVDGDPAKFKAARLKFENVRIILCLYHATENVKKHFGRMCLTTNTECEGKNVCACYTS